MSKKKSLFKVPRVKIGGLNISSKGISSSIKTPGGTYNTRKGWTGKKSILGQIFSAIFKLLSK